MAASILAITPVLRVESMDRALAHYCEKLGFHKAWEYQPDPERRDPAYAGLERDGWRLHVSSFPGDGVFGTRVALFVADLDDLARELTARGMDLGQGVMDQTWGNRELYLDDPDGNQLRFTQTESGAPD